MILGWWGNILTTIHNRGEHFPGLGANLLWEFDVKNNIEIAIGERLIRRLVGILIRGVVGDGDREALSGEAFHRAGTDHPGGMEADFANGIDMLDMVIKAQEGFA